VAFSLLIVLAELLTTPPTGDSHLALRWILGGPQGRWFWGMGIGVGHALPLVSLAIGIPGTGPLAVLAILVGMYVIEDLWVRAPQQVPLS
jgi:hypothetical protein